MTTKSKSRRERDAQLRLKAGGKIVNKRQSREKTALAWYELKNTHAASQRYIIDLGERMKQYVNVTVLAKIIKNGDKDRFDSLFNQIIEATKVTMVEFEALWNSHKDKKERCHSMKDVEAAMVIFGNYEKFDTDFFTTYQPLISELNLIFNKALRELLEAQDQANTTMASTAKAKMFEPVEGESNYDNNVQLVLPEEMTELSNGSEYTINHPGGTADIGTLQLTVPSSQGKTAVCNIDPVDLTGKATHAEVADKQTTN